MPVFFACTLVCDAEGCENTQPATAEMRSASPLKGLMGLLGGEAALFDFRYDRKMGLKWVVGNGKAACSDACHLKVGTPEKGEQAPGGWAPAQGRR